MATADIAQLEADTMRARETRVTMTASPTSHLCWAYQDRAEFLARALECIVEGIAIGQRVEYVGGGSVKALRADLAGLDGTNEALDGGDVEVSLVGDFYRLSGHSDAFGRYEHLLDRQMTVRPFSALCAYDSSELGSAAVTELACLHPLANTGAAPFRLYAEQDIDFALAGDIDLSCADLFATTLRRIVALSSGPEVIVDAQGLEFIDHRRLHVLIEAARRAGATVVLQNAPGSTVRMIEVLDFEGVTVGARK